MLITFSKLKHEQNQHVADRLLLSSFMPEMESESQWSQTKNGALPVSFSSDSLTPRASKETQLVEFIECLLESDGVSDRINH